MLKKILKIFGVIILITLAAGAGLYYTFRSGKLQQVVIEGVGQKLSVKQEEVSILEKALGLESPQTYLVLFLNNTELRPAGGFIGSYAVLKIDKGVPSLIKVEGTEILDNSAPDFEFAPPDQLMKILNIKRWNFRDSNWSPDFALASERALELYKKEGGVEADNIDGVIAFTVTSLEEVLKISGPVEVNGMVFNAGNFAEKLEYEVEYGYADKGINFSDRKKTLIDLTKVMLEKMRKDIFVNWSKYLALMERMADEKQLMAYSLNAQTQTFLSNKNWAGRMVLPPKGDYLMWVDANLGALKTDASIKRELTVKVDQVGKERMVNQVKMKYIHGGKFDWRTTRYQTYARIFVPIGTELTGIEGVEVPKPEKGKPKIDPLTLVDKGEENGFQWFGTFLKVEPGETKELSFKYVTPARMFQMLSNRTFRMRVQKQPGVVNQKLNTDFGFEHPILYATPGSHNGNYGEDRYKMSFDFLKDTDFEVEVSPVF